MNTKNTILAIFVIFVIVVPFGSAQQPDRGRTEALARRATDRLRSLQREADELASQERTLLGDLRRLQVERQIKVEELHQADASLQKAAADLAATSTDIESLEQEDLAERPALRARLVELYKLGAGRYFRLLLSTPDMRNVGQSSRMVATLAALDHARVVQHQKTVERLKSARAALIERNRTLEARRADARRAADAAARAQTAHEALVSQIDARRDLNAQYVAELQAAQQKLQASLGGRTPGDALDILPLAPFRGDLDWPVTLAPHRTPRPTSSRLGPSKGLEIPAGEGSPVSAVHDGVVAYADTFAGYGNLVIVDHGGQAFSLYGYLSDVAVKKGARVQRGDTLGTAGESATGQAGLYFELRVDGHPVDPLQWLKKR